MPAAPFANYDQKARGRLIVLMITAFMDMVGILMVVPLLPFYAKDMHQTGVMGHLLSAIGLGGEGTAVSLLIATYAVVQLISAPQWGRVSDRFGRRPAMMIGLGGSALAYLVFAYAPTLDWLFLSRIVQGAGGGTVGVIQAYVADSTKPEDRAKALGWLSAATNAGVALGPVIGGAALAYGRPRPRVRHERVQCAQSAQRAGYYLLPGKRTRAGEGSRRNAARVVRSTTLALRNTRRFSFTSATLSASVYSRSATNRRCGCLGSGHFNIARAINRWVYQFSQFPGDFCRAG